MTDPLTPERIAEAREDAAYWLEVSDAEQGKRINETFLAALRAVERIRTLPPQRQWARKNGEDVEVGQFYDADDIWRIFDTIDAARQEGP